MGGVIVDTHKVTRHWKVLVVELYGISDCEKLFDDGDDDDDE